MTRPLPISEPRPAPAVRPDAFAPWIAKGRRAVVDAGGGSDHMHQFCLIGGGHHHEIRQVGQKGDVKRPAWVAPSGPTTPARSMANKTSSS